MYHAPKVLVEYAGDSKLTKWMNPAAVSHVLMKIEHRFTNFIELLVEKALQHTAVIFNIQEYHYITESSEGVQRVTYCYSMVL